MLGSLDANGKTQNTSGSNSGCKWCMRSSLSDMCCLLLGQFRGTADVSSCTSAPIISCCDFNLTSSTAANLLLTVGCSSTTGGERCFWMGPLALGQIHLGCMLIWEYLPSQLAPTLLLFQLLSQTQLWLPLRNQNLLECCPPIRHDGLECKCLVLESLD